MLARSCASLRRALCLVDDLSVDDGHDGLDGGNLLDRDLEDVLVDDGQVGHLAHLDGAAPVLRVLLPCAAHGELLERLGDGDGEVLAVVLAGDKRLAVDCGRNGFYAGDHGVQSYEICKDVLDNFEFPEYKDPRWVTMDMFKIFSDGVHMGYSAWMKDDYTDQELLICNKLASLFSIRYKQLIRMEQVKSAGACEGLSRSEAMDRYGLTTREFQVAEKIALGCSEDEVAEALSVSESIVRKHLYNAYAKLAVNKRSQLEELFGRR